MIVRVHLPPHIADEIRLHAEQTYPDECCGFLLGTVDEHGVRHVKHVAPTPNRAPAGTERDRYHIGPADYLRIDRKARTMGWDILGIYHSHPDGTDTPSAVDLATAWPWYIYLILSVRSGRTVSCRTWTLDPNPQSPRFNEAQSTPDAPL